jgi:hypothetical protein
MAKTKVQTAPTEAKSKVIASDFVRQVASEPDAALATVNQASALLHLSGLLDRCAVEAYGAPDIPLDQKDNTIAALAARCAIADVIYTMTPSNEALDFASSVEKVITDAIRDQFRSRSPLAIPNAWHRLALIAKKETERLVQLGHIPSEEELKSAVMAVAMGEMISYNSVHPRNDPDFNPSFAADAYRAGLARLRKTGLLDGLDHLGEITSLRVTYRPRTLEARRYAGNLLKNQSQDSLRAIDRPGVSDHAAFDATEVSPIRPLGLHSQRIFGPLVAGTCSCGKYKNWTSQIECERCKVPTGPSSSRDVTCSYILVPAVVQRAGFVLPVIPVIPPSLRPCFQTRGTWEFSDMDRAYTRMLTICDIITSAGPVGPVLAQEAAELLGGCVSDLYGPEGVNSF